MTDAPSDPTPPTDRAPASAPAPARPGLRTFTIEGRAAPGLFVVGWLATLLGLGAIFVAILAGGGAAATIVFALGIVLLTAGLLAGAGSQALERRAAGGHPYTGPSPVLVFAAAFALAQLLALAVSLVLRGAGIDLPRAADDLLRVAIPGAADILVVAAVVVGTGALTWAQIGLRRDPARRVLADLAWGALLAGPVIGITMIVAALLVSVLRVTPPSPLPPTGSRPDSSCT